MKEQVTITRHEMAKICSDAVNTMNPDNMWVLSKLLVFAGLVMSIMFNDDEEADHE